MLYPVKFTPLTEQTAYSARLPRNSMLLLNWKEGATKVGGQCKLWGVKMFAETVSFESERRKLCLGVFRDIWRFRDDHLSC